MMLVLNHHLAALFFLQLNVGAHQEVSGRGQWADLEKEEEEQELIEESVSETELSSSAEED